jgi:large subunit ribosomal protein L5
MKARLQELYETGYIKELQKRFGFENVMRVPRIEKIVLNMGVKDAVADSKVLTLVQEVLSKIAGQTAVRTRARKSVAGFKLREGMAIGVMVTLRKKNMYCFLDKLINLALPCVRDFQGVSTKFDGHGNFNIGIADWMIFPEVDYDKVDKARGLNISVQTSAHNDEEARELLKCFNMPFRRKGRE